ncbi:M23 family metallopeptidase [Rhodopseudomonas sp. HC1]|uniref:M23 family metallopeptidase n=1 Tax=Rhodopseudomonas infernalis TaxID=2897386 RepID=UPI001EE935F3|nr:M23 family metallopeptidase [Rhodopseudomonas infernalis]MCG6203591.1 M23 family metallopeptidase [Rhodopseudomonas infernalis]
MRTRLGLPLLLIAAVVSLPAQCEEFSTPTLTALRIDWAEALDQLRAEVAPSPTAAVEFGLGSGPDLPAAGLRRVPAWVRLNAITGRFFPAIGQSAVPVLLPLDAATLLASDPDPRPESPALRSAQAGFEIGMFDAGPAGYDAVFTLDGNLGDSLPPRVFSRPVEVQITGSSLIYDIADPLGAKGEPVKDLTAQYPDLRRFIREGHVRYAFSRFGAAYVVSVQCLDSVPKARRLACREAYPVAEHLLKALRLAGGTPQRALRDIPAMPAERPAAQSADFTYWPSGEILPGSGFRKQDGRPDSTVYAQIRFPIEHTPAYAHSQSYKPRIKDGGGAGLFAYPWRDNFCESRSFGVGQCAMGFGHQGQDIRPGACLPDQPGCDVKQQGVVAVRDGVLIRSPRQQAVTLLVNTTREHIRFRYMHMHPAELDRDGVLDGRRVAEGERFGVVGNYLDFPNGTTRHLHFDVQVFTPDGWLWVNPYTTLVASYEKLIGGRGRDLTPTPTTPAVARAGPDNGLP